MAMTDMPLLQAIRAKMRWHQTRQTVLTQNVANADTPGYKPNDLKKLDFQGHLNQVRAPRVSLASTHADHISGSGETTGDFQKKKAGSFEITPDGNGVVLEEQMMKVTSNQMDYQAATSLYAKSLGMLRTAIGRRG